MQLDSDEIALKVKKGKRNCLGVMGQYMHTGVWRALLSGCTTGRGEIVDKKAPEDEVREKREEEGEREKS